MLSVSNQRAAEEKNKPFQHSLVNHDVLSLMQINFSLMMQDNRLQTYTVDYVDNWFMWYSAQPFIRLNTFSFHLLLVLVFLDVVETVWK